MKIMDNCIICKKPMDISKPCFFIHMTTSNIFVPKDYQGSDSQGWFPIGNDCAKKFKGLVFMYDHVRAQEIANWEADHGEKYQG